MEKKLRARRRPKRSFVLLMLCMLAPLLMGVLCFNTPGTGIPGSSDPNATGTVFGKTDFSQLKMFDANNGWATTPTSVLRTSDGGKTWTDVTPTDWEPLDEKTTSPISGIVGADFMDPSHIWIAAETTTPQSDIDKASTAVSEPTISPSGTATFDSGQTSNITTGTIVYVRSTIDGGQTWMTSKGLTVKDLASVSAPSFINAHEGWIELGNSDSSSGKVDGFVFHSIDGGLNWELDPGVIANIATHTSGLFEGSSGFVLNNASLSVKGSPSGLTVIPQCTAVAGGGGGLPECPAALPSPEQDCLVAPTQNYIALSTALDDGVSNKLPFTWLGEQTNATYYWNQVDVVPVPGGAYKQGDDSMIVSSPPIVNANATGVLPVQMQSDPDGDDPSHFFLHLFALDVIGAGNHYNIANLGPTSPFATPLVYAQHTLSAPDFTHVFVSGQQYTGNGKYGDWNLYEFDGANWITLKTELANTTATDPKSVLDPSLANVDFISDTEGFATDKTTLYHITIADNTATWTQIYPAVGDTTAPVPTRVPGKTITAPANPGPCGVQVFPGGPTGPTGPSNSKTHSITFVNKMNETIWVGQTGPTATNSDGWDGVLAPGASHSVTVSTPASESWSGRFWGRQCPNGVCDDKSGSSNAEPASLAEFDFNAYQGDVFYDVSLVDGFNLPIQIVPSDGSPAPDNCGSQACTDLTQSCPAPLQHKDANGNVDICMSACAVATDAGAPTLDQYCCLGAFGAGVCNPNTWPANMDSAKLFKDAYPHDYSYAYDDSTSTYTCPETCSYNIVFGTSP